MIVRIRIKPWRKAPRPRRRTALPSLTVSGGLHVAALAVLLAMPPPAPPPEASAENSAPTPTEIRIGDQLFFVTDLRATVGKVPEPPQPDKKSAASKARKPGHAAKAKLAGPPLSPLAAGSLARTFLPPSVRDPNATQILIQPESPADLKAPLTPLPNFHVLTEPIRIPKFHKEFIVPGRRNPLPPAAPPLWEPPPEVDLAREDMRLSAIQARLTLPPFPALVPTLMAPPGPLPATVGDPTDIRSVGDRPMPINARFVVPPGNLAPPNSSNPALSNSIDFYGSAASAMFRDEQAVTRSEAADNKGIAPVVRPIFASAAGTTAASTAAAGALAASGAMATLPDGTAAFGNPGNPGTSAAALRAGAAPIGPVILTRPANGTFSSMVLQASPLDQFPESRGLMNERPIYSVYVSVGTAMDWTLFFCVPQARLASENAALVQVGAPAPIKAPFPTRLVRPAISLPSWQRYILVHGYVTADGRFGGLSIVKPIQPDTDQALLASLAGWEFRAATKDDEPVAVEVLLSIPAKGL